MQQQKALSSLVKIFQNTLYLKTTGVNQFIFSNNDIPQVPAHKWNQQNQELFLSFSHGRKKLTEVVTMDYQSKAPKWLLFSNEQLDQINEDQDDKGNKLRMRQELGLIQKLQNCLQSEIFKDGSLIDQDFNDGKDPHLHQLDENIVKRALYYLTKILQDARIDEFQEIQQIMTKIINVEFLIQLMFQDIKSKNQEVKSDPSKKLIAYKINRAALLILEINS